MPSPLESAQFGIGKQHRNSDRRAVKGKAVATRFQGELKKMEVFVL
jgi:hypothetical protein